ncbi:MAG: hypothetical protein E7666_05820 [Ruminococcaceae bacterium]|nr:hypothetical protein [Oscillospiraceae bacterium]
MLKTKDHEINTETTVTSTDPKGDGTPISYRPTDFTDVGQATLLSALYHEKLRYSSATGFLKYNGQYWEEDNLGAQELSQALTTAQLNQATEQLVTARALLQNTGAALLLDGMSLKIAEGRMNDAQREAYQAWRQAKEFERFALNRRASKSITSTLQEARPLLQINPRLLDKNEYLLCTPAATYDLRLGLDGAQPHSAEDFITKITAVSPGKTGSEIWQKALNQFFCDDQELIEYVQQICGLATIGKIFVEGLIVAYGCGRNGKSTFWNTISKVLGTYSGTISSDVLTCGCQRNVKHDLAEINGKRFLISAELQVEDRLNDSMLKKLCSTDDISGEKKYKDPLPFTPQHTLVLYTNHLPKISASDDGTWRRMILIPFNAQFDGARDVKNFSDYLFSNAGESILAWIVEGAKKVIGAKYHLAIPKCVEKAIAEYREQNDWFNQFVSVCCDVDTDYRVSSSILYKAYHKYCNESNEYPRSTTDFYNTLFSKGFEKINLSGRKIIKGLRLKPNQE